LTLFVVEVKIRACQGQQD